ncbi:MAG TPA: tRNA pseudouridine(55) synthase TruB [Tahibacter sp.]|uniref:tRNA pseudouridine(55) synthase TruB n=1 Tax=Tahibacter sp. TaxID=2056211 RepID=UPI002BC3D059|nr:tRNA pseudouridine(55) synthase TruB [Tahibacter sp.]HSX59655.1 tRNA pseudouridine(55) synthase TruB [Tahibacter sp.]
MSKKKDPTPWRDVHGIVLLDKPRGLSSNQALQKARRLFLAAKGGHTGSLDPMATGLLPLCFGEATKIAGYLLGAAKAYTATVQLGATTTTGDADGDIVERRAVPVLTAAEIDAALAPLRGRITQVPPVYSALKLAGVPLYRRVRDGEEVSAAPREVDVHRLTLLRHDGDTLELAVECGSGTYVRSLARDLGEALGCGAHLIGLRRTWVDPFRAPRMHTLEELEHLLITQGREAIDALLLDTDAGLSALPVLGLDAEQAQRLIQGQPVPGLGDAVELCRVHDAAGRLLALGEIDAGGVLRVRRGLNLPA